jgi:hypothetical protein
MSTPRGFGLNGKSVYMNVAKPVTVWCNFIVDSTNGNGLGVRSIKSNGYIDNVFMKTTATPGTNAGITNPNPAAGYALIQFKNNFNFYLGGFTGFIKPTINNTTTALVAGNPYVITTLGTTTTAQWLSYGVFQGMTPAVGMSFISKVTASISGTGKVGQPGAQTTVSVGIVGDPNVSLNNSNVFTYGGALIMAQFSAATAAGDTTLIPAAPTDGSVVGMQFNFDASSVTIDGL